MVGFPFPPYRIIEEKPSQSEDDMEWSPTSPPKYNMQNPFTRTNLFAFQNPNNPFNIQQQNPTVNLSHGSFTVSDATLDFGIKVSTLELIEQLDKKQYKTNVACSPLSLTVAMNMLVPGAKGRTLDQFLVVLKADGVEQVYSRSSKLMELGKLRNDHSGSSNLICLANAAYFNKRRTMKPEYRHVIETVFMALIREVDLPNQEEAENKVNEGWVADKIINERIKRLLPRITLNPDVDELLELVLANVLYFKGLWETPFSESSTKEDRFCLLDGTSKNVMFMQKVSTNYRYTKSNNGYQLLKIPYQITKDDWRRFSMTIILPEENHGLPGLLQKFKSNPEDFSRPTNLSYKEVHLKLPRFKFLYEFQPCEKMIELGLTLPFQRDNTELTDIFWGDIPCYVSGVKQTTLIEVNEKGTECISRTVFACVSSFGAVCDKPKPIEFTVDHPCMFMIKEDVSDTVMCVGTVLDPLADK